MHEYNRYHGRLLENPEGDIVRVHLGMHLGNMHSGMHRHRAPCAETMKSLLIALPKPG